MPYFSSRSVIGVSRLFASVFDSCFLMYCSNLGLSGRIPSLWSYWHASILAFSLKLVVRRRVLGSFMGEEKRSGGVVPLVQAFAKAQVFVGELLGFRLLMCLFSASSFAVMMVFFFWISFSLHTALFDSHETPPLAGSHAFLAFLD